MLQCATSPAEPPVQSMRYQVPPCHVTELQPPPPSRILAATTTSPVARCRRLSGPPLSRDVTGRLLMFLQQAASPAQFFLLQRVVYMAQWPNKAVLTRSRPRYGPTVTT
jgi:hypothetical protein